MDDATVESANVANQASEEEPLASTAANEEHAGIEKPPQPQKKRPSTTTSDADGAEKKDEGHFDVDLENTLNLGVEEEPEIQAAVRVLLQGLGEDINREGIKKTPLRVAKALRHATTGYKRNAKDIIEGAIFPEAGLDNNRVGHAGGAGGLVIVRDLDLFSYCESCLLPFQVKCHVGYVPSGQRVVGLSKLSRVADVFAKRLQDPQRLADDMCSALQDSLKSAGIAVILQCHHIHFPALESVRGLIS